MVNEDSELVEQPCTELVGGRDGGAVEVRQCCAQTREACREHVGLPGTQVSVHGVRVGGRDACQRGVDRGGGVPQPFVHPRTQLIAGCPGKGHQHDAFDGHLSPGQGLGGECRDGVGLARAGAGLKHRRVRREGGHGVEGTGIHAVDHRHAPAWSSAAMASRRGSISHRARFLKRDSEAVMGSSGSAGSAVSARQSRSR